MMILHIGIHPNPYGLLVLSSVLKFAGLHSHAVLWPAVRVHCKLLIVSAVDERVQVRFFIRRLWSKCGHVVLISILHNLQ